MTIHTNSIKERKLMVKRLAEHLGVQATYLGVPSCGYRLGDISVDREGTIGGNPETLKRIVPFLLENHFITEETALREDLKADAPAEEPATAEPEETDAPDDTAAMETQLDSEADMEESMEDNTQDADTPDSVEEEADEDLEADDASNGSDTESSGITQMCVSVPLDDFTAPALINILKLVYTRQSLITAMTQSDLIHIDEELMDLLHDEKPDSVERICELLEGEIHADMVRGIDLADGKLTLSFPFDEADPTRWKHYSALMLAIVDRAKVAHHISGKRLDLKAEEEKYYCRNWLIQLGVGGAEHKETQRVLLDHLHGYAAFRSADKMAAHKAKYAALRKEHSDAMVSENKCEKE